MAVFQTYLSERRALSGVPPERMMRLAKGPITCRHGLLARKQADPEGDLPGAVKRFGEVAWCDPEP